MKNMIPLHVSSANADLMQGLSKELDHYKEQLRTLSLSAGSEHDRWYREVLEKLITRRSRMLQTLFPESFAELQAA